MGYDYLNQVCTPAPICTADPDLDAERTDQDTLGNQAILDQIATQSCGPEANSSQASMEPDVCLDQVSSVLDDQVCQIEDDPLLDAPTCEDPSALVCEAQDAVSDAQSQTPVCEEPQVSRPLDQMLNQERQDRGMDPLTGAAAQTGVQRDAATAFGQYYESSGTAQRSAYAMLDAADALDAVMPGGGQVLRSAAMAVVQVQLNAARQSAIDSVVASSMSSLSPDSTVLDPCAEQRIRAQVEAQFPAQAFDPSTLSGSSQDVRFALTTGFDAQRTRVQSSMEGMAGTQFRQRVTGDATGLHMTMMTQADYDAQMARDEATGAARMDAGHLHATGTAANGVTANENMQTMLRDMYSFRTTSNLGNRLTDQLVAGQGQNFDTRFDADNQSASIDGDSFLTNGVDVHDLRDPAMVPPRVAGPTAHGPIDVQSTGSAYAHFMAERQYDAQNGATDMAALRTNDAALQTQRQALITSLATLSPAEQASINAGTGPTTPAGQAWVASATAWQASYNAHTASFNNRFNSAHAHGLSTENEYNREQGMAPTARH